MYGKDRLTQPLLRMKNGKYDKEGEFTPITWDQAFDVMEDKFKTALKEDVYKRQILLGDDDATLISELQQMFPAADSALADLTFQQHVREAVSYTHLDVYKRQH